MKLVLLAIYSVIILIPAILWWNNNSLIFTAAPIADPTADIVWYAVGQVAALTGFSMMIMQLVLAARLPFIERVFGQDAIMRFHRKTGLTAFIFILLHPIALTTSFFIVDPILAKDFLLPTWGWKLLGQISLSLLFVIIILSVWTSLFKLKYHWWKRIHMLVYLVLIGGFIHSMMLGSDLITSGSLRTYWFILVIIGLLAFLYHRGIQSLWPRLHPYTIQAIRTEATRVHTISFETNPKHKFTYVPGQFLFVKFFSKYIKGEWHPFTISSSPTEANLSLSIKESGDWTSTLGELLPGDKALIQAPFGRFSFMKVKSQADTARDIVCIAGGIGITPFRSMIKYLFDQPDVKQHLQLLFANRTRHDIAFRQELDDIDKTSSTITVRHILSDDPTWPGDHGRIDKNYVTKHITDVTNKEFFVCGPLPMMTAIKKILKELQVPRSQIHTEEFSLK